MYDYENDYLFNELLNETEKIKLEMLISHILLSRMTGQGYEEFQSLSYLKKRNYMLRLYKKAVLSRSGPKKQQRRLYEQNL